MDCASFVSSLSTLTKPTFVGHPHTHARPSEGLIVLSVPAPTPGRASGGRCARLRKSTSQSKLIGVAFALGERCRQVLLKRSKSRARPVAPVVVSEAPADCRASLSDPPRLERPASYASSASSFVTVSYSESASASGCGRTSYSSELSFWCCGLPCSNDPCGTCGERSKLSEGDQRSQSQCGACIGGNLAKCSK